MEAVKILDLMGKMLNLMSENGLRVEDYKYIDLYLEFRELRENHEKYDYALDFISKKYDISPSTTKRIIKRLGRRL